MPQPIPTILFWISAAAVVIGQVFILRSTGRAWRTAGTRVPFVEQVFAWGPALVLIAVLWLSWRATNAAPTASSVLPSVPGSVQP